MNFGHGHSFRLLVLGQPWPRWHHVHCFLHRPRPWSWDVFCKLTLSLSSFLSLSWRLWKLRLFSLANCPKLICLSCNCQALSVRIRGVPWLERLICLSVQPHYWMALYNESNRDKHLLASRHTHTQNHTICIFSEVPAHYPYRAWQAPCMKSWCKVKM